MTIKDQLMRFLSFVPLVSALMLFSAPHVQIGRAAPVQTAGGQSQEREQGGKIYSQACIQCHDVTPTVIQRKTAEGWRKTVYSMISRGAWLMPDEIEPLIAYLAATYGPDAPVPGGTVGATLLPEAPGKAILERSCVQCHTLEMVTNVRRSQPGWEETIDRMKTYGARLTQEEREILVKYVTSHFRVQ